MKYIYSLLMLPMMMQVALAAPKKNASNVTSLATTSEVLKINQLDFPGVRHILSGTNFTALVSEDQIYVKLKGKDKFSRISEVIPSFSAANLQFDAAVVSESNKLVVSVSDYPKEQKEKDSAQPRGGFVAGPTPVGLIEISFDTLKTRTINSLTVKTKPKDSGELGSTVNSYGQVLANDGPKLISGAYGLFQRIDLTNGTTEVLESEEMEMLSRVGLSVIPAGYWVYVSAGGYGAELVEFFPRKGKTETYGLPSFSKQENSFWDLIHFQGRVLLASSQGLVELSTSKKPSKLYSVSKEADKNAVYELINVKDTLWGVNAQHLVRYDLKNKKAKLYEIPGTSKDNVPMAIGFVDNKWYVSTKNFLGELIDYKE